MPLVTILLFNQIKTKNLLCIFKVLNSNFIIVTSFSALDHLTHNMYGCENVAAMDGKKFFHFAKKNFSRHTKHKYTQHTSQPQDEKNRYFE